MAQIDKRPRLVVAANDNRPGRRRVVLSGIHPQLPIGESEVEIFDALLSNLKALAANDNLPGEIKPDV